MEKHSNPLAGLVPEEEIEQIQLKIEKEKLLVSQISEMLAGMLLSDAKDVLYRAEKKINSQAILPAS